jgi:predicted phosphodiesterase
MTKIGSIADIHSNYSALKVALDFLEGKIDILICAGDFVGYGPQPVDCLNSLLDYPLPHYYCIGNHDLGVRYEYCRKNSLKKYRKDKKILSSFTIRPAAEVMFRRNAKELAKEHYRFLEKLSFKTFFEIDGNTFYLTHGIPSKSINDNVGRYLPAPPIQTSKETIEKAEHFKKTKKVDFIIIGHTHQRFFINRANLQSWSHIGDRYSKKETKYPKEFSFSRSKVIINPGSIGLPRDGDPSASFVIIDTETEKIKFYAMQYSRTEFYKLIQIKGDPLVRDPSFWEINF